MKANFVTILQKSVSIKNILTHQTSKFIKNLNYQIANCKRNRSGFELYLATVISQYSGEYNIP